jgi:CubicO group peptidase (beta-lactamase class C family)
MVSPNGKPELFSMMEDGVRRGVFPGGVLVVRKNGIIRHRSAHGHLALDSPAGVDFGTIFDLASLTKVLATSGLVLDLISRGLFDLGSRVADCIPGFSGDGREQIQVVHLLEHSSGFIAHRPYFKDVPTSEVATLMGRDAIRKRVRNERPETAPGAVALYSDLGFILLDWLIEEVTGQALDDLFLDRIAIPLSLRDIFFIDLKEPAKADAARAERVFAATEFCQWRGRMLLGEVQDENAYAMGGVSGHSGLFGTADEVMRLATAWLDGLRGRAGLFDPRWVQRFFRKSAQPGSTRALGFDTPSPEGSQAGQHFGPSAVGHLGFTGTSLWIDPDQDLIVVLLTNRVHPTRTNETIKEFRPRLHDAIVAAFGGH